MSDAVTSDPRGAVGNGAIVYTIDVAGNRPARTSSLSAIRPTSSQYDANDQFASDVYDPNGSTTSADGNTCAYGFENRRISKTSAP